MKNELRSRLNQVLEGMAAKNNKQDGAREDRRRSENADLRAFIDLRENVIRPKILEIISYLGDHSVYCRVSTDEPFQVESGRKIKSNNITFWIYNRALISDDLSRVPNYSIRWDDINHIVKFEKSSVTREQSGEIAYDASVPLHELNASLVEERLFAFTKWILC